MFLRVKPVGNKISSKISESMEKKKKIDCDRQFAPNESPSYFYMIID